MAPAAYVLLFLLGVAIYTNNNNRKQSAVEVIEKVDISEDAKKIEQTTIPFKNEKDLCDEFENVEPSLGKYQLIVDAPNGKYTPNARYKGEQRLMLFWHHFSNLDFIFFSHSVARK